MSTSIPHGMYTRYINNSCRCRVCTKAWAAYTRDQVDRRRQALAPDDQRHGQRNTYNNYGCRCAPCRDADRTYRSARTAS